MTLDTFEEVPQISEKEWQEVEYARAVATVDKMINEEGVWYFLNLLNKESFLKLCDAMDNSI